MIRPAIANPAGIRYAATALPALGRMLALMALLLAPGWLRAENSRAYFLTALEAGKHQRIVVYGTSLTASSAWPAGLQETLRKTYGRKAKLINSGGGGMDSRWGLSNLAQRVIRQRPDVVFIEFAINDALEKSGLDVAESMANLTTMVTRIRRDLPYCDLVVMIMNPPTGDALKKRPDYADYAAGYRRVAEKLSCRLIDFSALWNDLIHEQPELWQRYAPDGLHPNPQASREIILPFLLEKIGYHATASR